MSNTRLRKKQCGFLWALVAFALAAPSAPEIGSERVCLAPPSFQHALSLDFIYNELHASRDQVETLKNDPSFNFSLTQKVSFLIQSRKEAGLSLENEDPYLEEAAWWVIHCPSRQRNALLGELLADILILDQNRSSNPDKWLPLTSGIVREIAKAHRDQTSDPVGITRALKECFAEAKTSPHFYPDEYAPFEGNLEQRQPYDFSAPGDSPALAAQVDRLRRNLRQRFYYRHFFNLLEGDPFNEDEIVQRVLTAAKVLPKVKEALAKFKKSRRGEWSLARKTEQGTFQSHLENGKGVGTYITGSYLWGMGTKTVEGNLISIPPGDMDVVVVIEDEEKIMEVIPTKKKISLDNFFLKGERGYGSVTSMDILVISTGFLKEQFEDGPGASNTHPAERKKAARRLVNLLGSGVAIEGFDVVEECRIGYRNFIAASHGLYKESQINAHQKDHRWNPRKAVNRMLEAVLQINEAVKDWNQKNPHQPLQPISLSLPRLRSLFKALGKDLKFKDENGGKLVDGYQSKTTLELEKFWQEYNILVDLFSKKPALVKSVQNGLARLEGKKGTRRSFENDPLFSPAQQFAVSTAI